MTHRTFDEQIANFNRVVSSWDINQEYKVALLGMIASLGYEHEKSITPEPQWIPVTEDTLPEEGRIVVVCGEKGTWDYGKYRGYGPNIHYWYWKNKTFKKVYWWMYKEDALPEPTRG